MCVESLSLPVPQKPGGSMRSLRQFSDVQWYLSKKVENGVQTARDSDGLGLRCRLSKGEQGPSSPSELVG